MLTAFLIDFNVIGSIRIYSEWFEKPIEIFDRNDRIDVYCVPYLPFWYVLKCIYDKVGADRMNELANVCLCDEEQTEESLPPVIIRNNYGVGSMGLTQALCPDTYIDYPGNRIIFEETDDTKLSYEVEDHIWKVLIPNSWDMFSVRVQRDLTKYVNNILPKVAEQFIPSYYKELLSANGFPDGKCNVVITDNGGGYKNENGGYDIQVPFSLIKMPIEVIQVYLLWPYVEEGSPAEKDLKRYRYYVTDGFTTGYADEKLLTSKFKRDCLKDKYGKLLFR